MIPMELRLLGNSGLEVSALSFGTMTLGGEGRFAAMGNVQVEEARRLIEICLEAGVNTFDTADIYSLGKSEEVLGQALGARRKDVVLATKVFARLEPGHHKAGLSRKHIVEACEASLRRLGTDYIDLYQAHNFDALTPLDETLAAFDDLIRSGKVRYAGCSNYCGWQLMKSLAISRANHLAPRYISQQINYSLLARDAEHELIPAGLDQGVGVMAWSPLHFGLLSGKFRRGQDAPARVAPAHSRRPRYHRHGARLPHCRCPRRHRRSARRLHRLRSLSTGSSANPASIQSSSAPATNSQLRDNLAAAAWSLSNDEMAQLDAVSALPLPYPNWHQQKFAAERNPPLPPIRA